MKNVYICYSGYDYNTALHITSVLEDNNEAIIVSRTDLNEDIEVAYTRIANAHLFIYLISQEALDDPFWRQQLDYAVKIGVPAQGLIVRHPDGIMPSPGGLYPIDLTNGVTPASLRRLQQVLDATEQTSAGPRINTFVVLVIVLLIAGLALYFFLTRDSGDTQVTQLATNTIMSTSQPIINPTDTATAEPSTSTSTPTYTMTQTQTVTASLTATSTATTTPSATITNTSTTTPTTTPSDTIAPTQTEITAVSNLVTASETVQPSTQIPSATSTKMPTATYTLTATLSPSATDTLTSTATLIPTNTDVPTSTSTATFTRTPSPTATITPSPTSTFTPSNTPTIDPNSVVCPGAPVSRLLVNEYAEVIHFDGISVRGKPGLTSQWIVYLPVASEVYLIDGPVCADQFRWWEIDLGDDETGWVAEGDIVYYYLELMPSPTPTATSE